MERILPTRFLFRYSIPVRYRKQLPAQGGRLLALPEECSFPNLAELDGAKRIGDLRLAWNEHGFAVSVQVRGKSQKLECDSRVPDISDGLQVWIDTRNTQTIHRASRFCHHFVLLPTGNSTSRGRPFATQIPIARAREETPLVSSSDLSIVAEVTRDGYWLESWFPAKVLHGFDPEANPRLGFYYAIRDHELGDEYLSVGHEFPFALDPSLWATLELVRP